MSFITDEMVEKSLNFLRDNAQELGRARGAMIAADHKRKVIRAEELLKAEGKTVTEREALAETSPAYQNAIELLENATADYHILQTRVKAAESKIEVWRSLNARSNRGHL